MERERELQGDGAFASKECVEFLKQADIVVTNPPFSLFREYLAQLVKYEKQFIILGNMNAIANKEIFPLFQSNKCWYGVTGRKGAKFFVVPEGHPYDKIEDGIPLKSATVQWFTNLVHKNRHQNLDLWAKYTPADYPKYDNYDAIEVSKTVEIPKDYDGIMGVPVSFMDKYNPDQFEILGLDRYTYEPIRTKVYSKAEMQIHGPLNGRTVLADANGKLSQLYARILIRRKQ